MISVYDLLYLYANDDEIEIWDCLTQETIFHGYRDDLDYNIEQLEVMSYDIDWTTKTFTINVDYETEDE